MRIYFHLACALSALSFVACTPHDYNTAPPTPRPASYAPEFVRDIAQLNLPDLKCETDAACPSGVGELISVRDGGIRFCTVTLVKSNLVLTASHCVNNPGAKPDDDRKLQGCWIRFPGRGGEPPTAVACDSLVSFTPIDKEPGEHPHADQALIKLASEQTNREIQKITDPSSLSESPVKLSVIGLSLTKDAHTLRRLECERSADAVSGLNLNPATTILLPNCMIEPGFSGGPILKDDLQIATMSFVHPKPFTAVAMPISAFARKRDLKR